MLIDILEPMGAQFDRLRCEVCQNLFLSPMNTGFLRHAVATVLTVYGIETVTSNNMQNNKILFKLQQCLPFTVLKLVGTLYMLLSILLTLQQCLPFTVLKPIEISESCAKKFRSLQQCLPFTVLKPEILYRLHSVLMSCNSAYRLRY